MGTVNKRDHGFALNVSCSGSTMLISTLRDEFCMLTISIFDPYEAPRLAFRLLEEPQSLFYWRFFDFWGWTNIASPAIFPTYQVVPIPI